MERAPAHQHYLILAASSKIDAPNDKVIKMARRIDHKRFLGMLTERFPEVAATIDDCSRGILHLEMATLAHATQAAIDNQDRDTVRHHFLFIDGILAHSAPDVENAVHVSYLEHLRFEGRKAAPTRAKELLTPRLKQALAQIEVYLDQLFGHGGKG